MRRLLHQLRSNTSLNVLHSNAHTLRSADLTVNVQLTILLKINEHHCSTLIWPTFGALILLEVRGKDLKRESSEEFDHAAGFGDGAGYRCTEELSTPSCILVSIGTFQGHNNLRGIGPSVRRQRRRARWSQDSFPELNLRDSRTSLSLKSMRRERKGIPIANSVHLVYPMYLSSGTIHKSICVCAVSASPTRM